MADRGMIFSAPMVRALLAGTKSQTRRVIRGLAPSDCLRQSPFVSSGVETQHGREVRPPCRPGDRLWVRETWQQWPPKGTEDDRIYRATDAEPPASDIPEWAHHWRDKDDNLRFRWQSPIRMPRCASRLTLLVSDVRVQRLQDITEADAAAEGLEQDNRTGRLAFKDYGATTAVWWFDAAHSYRTLWNSLHGPDAWARNDWVAAITFSVVQANIDAVPA